MGGDRVANHLVDVAPVGVHFGDAVGGWVGGWGVGWGRRRRVLKLATVSLGWLGGWVEEGWVTMPQMMYGMSGWVGGWVGLSFFLLTLARPWRSWSYRPSSFHPPPFQRGIRNRG